MLLLLVWLASIIALDKKEMEFSAMLSVEQILNEISGNTIASAKKLKTHFASFQFIDSL